MTSRGQTSDEGLYLASRSPRRRELLAQIGLAVVLIDGETDETRSRGESPRDYVLRIALAKGRAGRARLPPDTARPVLAADTVVVVDDQTLGKPADRQSAIEMLRTLSGRSHRVLTAVALITNERELTALSDSRVTFRHLSESEILRYCDSGEPLDKAGAYGIQGYGALFVADLQGSYSGVMGLPLCETGRLLEAVGIQLIPSSRQTPVLSAPEQ